MKKILLILLLAAMITPVFAEDAKVLPQGVGRFYLVPGYAWADEVWDDKGKTDDITLGSGEIDSASFANLAFALEYGVLPWMSAGVKWIPGWVYWSEFDSDDIDDANANDLSDFEVGLKTQIVGPEAPVQSDVIRWVVTPGFFVPTAGPDWEDEAEAAADGDEFTAQAAANHALGFGAYTAVDYVVNDNFFVSLFAEGRFYQSKKYEDVSLTTYSTKSQIDGTTSFEVSGTGTAFDGATISDISVDGPSEQVNLGYDLNIELSPHFETEATPGVRVGASLPIDFRYTPGLSFVKDYEADANFDGATTSGAPLLTALQGAGLSATEAEATAADLESGFEDSVTDSAEAALEDTDSYTWTVTPGASVFFTAIPVPIEVTLDWAIPVAGTNAIKQSSISSQIRFYFAF